MPTPAAILHERLLVALHRAMVSGDKSEADRLREQMEAPWYYMTALECLDADAMSEDLYAAAASQRRWAGRGYLVVAAALGT